MRSALLAVLTRLLFPLEDEDLGVQHEHFRQRLFELPAEVHALAHRIDPQLGNRRDPLFAMDHEGERPEGVTLAVGTVAGRLAATAVSEGERAGKGVGREIETGDKLPFAPPKTVGGRAGGGGASLDYELTLDAPAGEHTVAVRVWDGNDNLAVDKVVVK